MFQNHVQLHPPLTPPEVEAFEWLLPLPKDPFQAWLADEIFTRPRVSVPRRAAGVAGFITGAVSGLVTYYLAKDLMKIFGANEQVSSFMGSVVFISRFPLGGNALQDSIENTLHDFNQKNKLPHKNNQRALRYAADAFVYVSSAALGVMGVYIMWNNLPYNTALKSFFLPSVLVAWSVVNVQPFLDANIDLFARYSQGVTPLIREKRAAIIEALNLALNEIRAYDAAKFDDFYHHMTGYRETSGAIQARWEKLLRLAENPTQPAIPAKSAFTKARGYFGWLLSLLSSLTNIQISYAEAKWLAKVLNTDNDSFVPAFGIISSFLCVVAYGVLCAGPTQAVFENQQVKKGWEPTHPWLRKGAVVLAGILGFSSAIPNASWPIVLGQQDYEKALAGPAFLSAGSLYFSACLILLNRLIDAYDRWQGQSQVIDHMDFLAALQSLTRAVAQLPDDVVDKMIGIEHPILLQYRARHQDDADNAARPMLKSMVPLNRS